MIDQFPELPLPQIRAVNSNTRPPNPFPGQIVYELDTGRMLAWKGTAWKLLTPELEGLAPTSPYAGPSAGNNAVLATMILSKSYIGLPVNIFATANGWVLDTISTGPIDHSANLEISTDGGANWVNGRGFVDTTRADQAKFRGTWALSEMYVATPTGTVQVRLRVSQAGGTISAKSWYDTVINVQVVGV
jgi:hypothetical protein